MAWLQQKHLLAKRGETGWEIVAEFYLSVGLSLSYFKGSLTCRQILRCEGFTSPLKEVLLRNFIALKNQTLSAGFEPENLESSDKHDNHYTTKNVSDVFTTDFIYQDSRQV
jgi:hypothetical protein